jgi:hypothetical protein
MTQRVVVCQGPIQLVTAVTVLTQVAQERGRIDGTRDHLVIAGLWAPAGQEAGLVAAIRAMAAHLWRWSSVSVLSASQVDALEHAADKRADLERMMNVLLSDVREVYVVREWQTLNQVVLSAFPGAHKIGYGDAIGIYLSPNFMRPAQPLLRGAAQGLRARLRALKPGAARASALDVYYLTIPDAFDRVPKAELRRTRPALLRATMDKLSELVPESVVERLRPLLNGRRLIVLATSNFSEQGVMSADSEISAYVEHLRGTAPVRDGLVLLKPHPRDDQGKVARLQQALRACFSDVLVPSDADGAYLPLEAVLLRLERAVPEMLGFEVFTYSSACLASRYILNLTPEIGFGDELVKRNFRAPYVNARIVHERQLRAACRLTTT